LPISLTAAFPLCTFACTTLRPVLAWRIASASWLAAPDVPGFWCHLLCLCVAFCLLLLGRETQTAAAEQSYLPSLDVRGVERRWKRQRRAKGWGQLAANTSCEVASLGILLHKGDGQTELEWCATPHGGSSAERILPLGVSANERAQTFPDFPKTWANVVSCLQSLRLEERRILAPPNDGPPTASGVVARSYKWCNNIRPVEIPCPRTSPITAPISTEMLSRTACSESGLGWSTRCPRRVREPIVRPRQQPTRTQICSRRVSNQTLSLFRNERARHARANSRTCKARCLTGSTGSPGLWRSAAMREIQYSASTSLRRSSQNSGIGPESSSHKRPGQVIHDQHRHGA